MGVTGGLLDGTVELLEYCLTQVDNSHLIFLTLELLMKKVFRSWIDGFPLLHNFTRFNGREVTRTRVNKMVLKKKTQHLFFFFFFFEDMFRPAVTTEICLKSKKGL